MEDFRLYSRVDELEIKLDTLAKEVYNIYTLLKEAQLTASTLKEKEKKDD